MANLDETQVQFIDMLSALRRRKKISQKDIHLAQKVISRLENHEVDPRLSTVIAYLDDLGYDINELFEEDSLMKRPSAMMVEHLNLKLKEEGSCLRYVEMRKEDELITYELKVIDQYVDSRVGSHISITPKFDAMVREFFKKYGAEDIGFTNTVATIYSLT